MSCWTNAIQNILIGNHMWFTQIIHETESKLKLEQQSISFVSKRDRSSFEKPFL